MTQHPGAWTAAGMIAAVVLSSTCGEVLTAAAMKSIGDLDEIRARSGLKGAIRAVVTCPLFFAGVFFLALAFFALLFAFRWALRDQRQRCPVCLRLLSNPAHVGEASRNFLAWNGTELICAEGHGLLHIPELPTSWFSTQRWLYLDPSWSALFADAY